MKLLVTYKMKNNNAEDFLNALSDIGIPGLVRAEKGCARYDYFLPADDAADRVVLIEEWDSAETQALHLGQPHMKRLAEIKPIYVSETTVELID